MLTMRSLSVLSTVTDCAVEPFTWHDNFSGNFQNIANAGTTYRVYATMGDCPIAHTIEVVSGTTTIASFNGATGEFQLG